MSYPMDLDEYTEGQLIRELKRRKHIREAGCCDYCGRSIETPACKFPARHRHEPGLGDKK